MFREMSSSFIKVLVVFGLLFFIVGAVGGSKVEAADYTFKFGYWVPAKLSFGVANDRWSRLVEKLSNGRIKIENYPGGAIASEHKTISLVKAGTLDIGQATTQNMGQFTDIYRPFDVFYVVPSAEAIIRLYEQTDVGREIDEYLQKTQGLKTLYYQPMAGYRVIINNKREVRTPKDLKKLKLRSTATPIEEYSLKALGANPVPLPFPECYMALQQGMLNGLHIDYECVLFCRFDEVTKYGTVMKGQHAVEVAAMSTKKWNALPKDLQQVFIDATNITFVDRLKVSLEGVDNDLKKIEERGTKSYFPTEAEVAKWRQATEDAAKKLAEKGILDLDKVEKMRKKLTDIQERCYMGGQTVKVLD